MSNTTSFLSLFLLTYLFSPTLFAQVTVERRSDIPVIVNGSPLPFPWVGGLNNPQFSSADINLDGIQDLFVFDRSDDQILPFINGGIAGEIDYTFGWDYQQSFPDLKNWALLLDYNCDEITDIFTAFEDGVRVYQGHVNTAGDLAFTLTFSKLNFDTDEAIFVSIFDIPAITDIDEDGDIDILTFDNTGTFVEYYQNQAVEMGFNCDSLSFVKASECWGDFAEDSGSGILLLETDCGGLATSDIAPHHAKQLHANSTLLAIDLDGDLDKELIIGDLANPMLVMASNSGDLTTAYMTEQDTLFPFYNVPANVWNFPAAFSVDVNNDGLKDLLVSPNIEISGDHFECAWYYQNVGDATTPLFSFQTDSFLVDGMVDVSRTSYPVFFDHNADGLLDMLLGHVGNIDFGEVTSALALYENTGTLTQPEFTLISKNYMDIAAQFSAEQVVFKPTLGDIDGDMDEDMLIGTGLGTLHLFENTPDADGKAHFTLSQENYQGIDVGHFAAPQWADLNGDGLLDLVIGERNGNLNYWENTGTSTAAAYTLVNDFFGEIDVQATGTTTGYSIPYLFKWETSGAWQLLVGSESGNIFWYENIESNLIEGGFTLLSEQFADLNTGSFSSAAVLDIDQNGRKEVVIGTFRGGVEWFEQPSTVGIASQQPSILNFQPNPVSNILTIELPPSLLVATTATVHFYNVNGQQVFSQTYALAQQAYMTVDVSTLVKGLYFSAVYINDNCFTQKIVVE